MPKKTYAEKLLDPRWQRKRLEIMQYADFRCQLCGDAESTLHVHHSYYLSGNEPWDYPNGSFACLCEIHHEIVHNLRAEPDAVEATLATLLANLEEGLQIVDPDRLDRILSLADKISEAYSQRV